MEAIKIGDIVTMKSLVIRDYIAHTNEFLCALSNYEQEEDDLDDIYIPGYILPFNVFTEWVYICPSNSWVHKGIAFGLERMGYINNISNGKSEIHQPYATDKIRFQFRVTENFEQTGIAIITSIPNNGNWEGYTPVVEEWQCTKQPAYKQDGDSYIGRTIEDMQYTIIDIYSNGRGNTVYQLIDESGSVWWTTYVNIFNNK